MSQHNRELPDARREVLMASQNAADLYAALDRLGIKVWVDGGWAVDALLGRQLRPHRDLDVAVEWRDVPRLREYLRAKGYNQAREDSQWNFVLADDEEHEVDVHAFVRDDEGNVVGGIMYPTDSLSGNGTIAGREVRCISAPHVVQFLAPWLHKWPDKYLPAVSALCEKFGIELPREYLERTKQLS